MEPENKELVKALFIAFIIVIGIVITGMTSIDFITDDDLPHVDSNHQAADGLKIVDHGEYTVISDYGIVHIVPNLNVPPPKNGTLPTLTIDEFNCTGFDCITWEYRE